MESLIGGVREFKGVQCLLGVMLGSLAKAKRDVWDRVVEDGEVVVG